MSLVIFFGMALFIFLMGLVVMGVTFHHWWIESRQKKMQTPVSGGSVEFKSE